MKVPSFVTVREHAAGRRYEVRLEVTGADGKRRQQRRRFTTLKEAVDAYTAVHTARATGTHTAPAELTVKAACEDWLSGQRIKPTTAAAYAAALRPVIDRYGSRQCQRITKADVEALVAELRDGTGPRGVWARTTINPMLARWRAVWTDQHAQGVLARNVVALVEPLRKRSGEPSLKLDDVLTEQLVRQLVDAHEVDLTLPRPTRDRINAEHAHLRVPFLHLALLGLRRGEIAGLRWSAINLDATPPTLTVRATRIATVGGVYEQDDTKTRSSARTLALPPHLVPILRRTRRDQLRMRAAFGSQWRGPRGDGYVVAHPDGQPPSPRTLNSWWNRSLRYAGVPHRRLHASRHTAATLLHLRGAPTATVAAWLGHADGVLAMRTYAHTSADSLQAAAALLAITAEG
ncbi:integrase [Mycolicibacterium cyprinidarum]|uniref:Integrase n=1 Tax=Mycolicibacterium cyprinidarum TaxID=2860311 RepID=A0ABQ4V534_9MYCO|nr:integrase [Mycolicibacterium sp. NGTWSNA01]GJF17476.1 integrase [Mycolicibacterium sp. NGTWS0302]